LCRYNAAPAGDATTPGLAGGGTAAAAAPVDDDDGGYGAGASALGGGGGDPGVSLTGLPTVEGTALGAEALAEYLREIAAIGATSAPPPVGAVQVESSLLIA
jgi:hypothetical protein